jgi:hypothetical protein
VYEDILIVSISLKCHMKSKMQKIDILLKI